MTTTKQAQHTPGPWHLECHTGEIRIFPPSPERCGIAELNGTNETSQANARLIAAAPTMYEYIRKKAGEGDSEAVGIWEAVNAHS